MIILSVFFCNCALILLVILLKIEEVVEIMKNIIEMFDSLQEDVNQLKKGTLPQETKMIPYNSLRVNLEICTSSSRPQSREDRSQSHDQALLRQSCSPWRHKRLADHMDKNEDKREIDSEDLDKFSGQQ